MTIDHPKNERHFYCGCGELHEWVWGHRPAGYWSHVYIFCPKCGATHRKEMTDAEAKTYPGAKSVSARLARENPVVPYDEDAAFISEWKALK